MGARLQNPSLSSGRLTYPAIIWAFVTTGGKKEIVMEKQLVISATAMTFGSVAVTGNLGLLLGRKTEGNI